MRTRMTTWIVGSAMLFCAAFTSAQEAPSAEYVQAMQDILAAVQTLTEVGEAPDPGQEEFESASSAAESAVAAFEYVKGFWPDLGTDAGQLAVAGWEAALSINVGADFNNIEGVNFAFGEMTATCMPCHDAHRGGEPGSFVINK